MKTLFILFTAFTVQAADHFGQTVAGLDGFHVKRLQVEALAHTASNASSLSFGPSINYKWTDTNHMVFRTAAPMAGFSEPGDVETMSAQVLWRHKLTETRSSFFTELGVAYNQYRFGPNNAGFVEGPSMGTNLGITYQVNNELSVGGLAGFEWANQIIDRQLVEGDTDIRLYPRMAVMVGLNL